MSVIRYSKPAYNEINVQNKPTPYSGKDYPLRDLEHRNFEELIYCLHVKEIELECINFDDIALMSGIRDKAQDCVLYRNHTKRGLIQCKHSSKDNPLSVKVCVEEIIKYLLYTIQDVDLLPDINDFTYYFASSSGFKSDADKFLRTFNKSISKESNVELWTQNVLKTSKTLTMSYNDVEAKLREKLGMISIQLIVPKDIHTLLNKYESSISGLFFEVKKVVDNTEVLKVQESLSDLQKRLKPKQITQETILKEFAEASLFLSEYKNYFSLKNPLKLERQITNEIINWIKTPLNNNASPYAILKGSAGSGKSVILNEVYHHLLKEHIPVLALKADEQSAEDIDELGRKLGLSLPLEESVEKLANNNQKVVIIIDQIDALSHALSANRALLSTYVLLSEKLAKIPNVRVIISVREFDLNYDPHLTRFKKNTSFDSGFLSASEVSKVLNILSVFNPSPKLVTLLSTPLHLELFCKVYIPQKPFQFNSLYDLYNRLWYLKIVKRKNRELQNLFTDTLFTISRKIYEKQGSLSVNATHFDPETVNYLKTEGLLSEVNNSKGISFFHQSFYDYVFARQFVESNKDVIVYLNENEQGILIRSCLKIILAHLRDHDAKSYRSLIITLLTDNNIRFHIKQLTLSYFGFLDDPTSAEKDIFKEYILRSSVETIFYEVVNSNDWVDHLVQTGIVSEHLRAGNDQKANAILQLFLRNMNNPGSNVIQHISSLPPTSYTDALISRVLFYLNTWDNTSIQLFDKIKNTAIKNEYEFCRYLEKGVFYNEEWAFGLLQSELLRRCQDLSPYGKDFQIGHYEIELLKKFFNRNPDKTYWLCFEILREIIEKTSEQSIIDHLWISSVYKYFSRSGHKSDPDKLLEFFISKTEYYARVEHGNFQVLNEKLKDTHYTPFLLILIHGYLAHPVGYYSTAYSLLLHVHSVNKLYCEDSLEYWLRKLISSIYSYLSYNEKANLNTLLLDINIQYEIGIFPISDSKNTIRSRKGFYQYQFLSAITLNELIQFPEAYRRYQELNRRFGEVKDREPNIFGIAKNVSAPYAKQNYEKMSLKNWEQTFWKYNDQWKEDFYAFGGGKAEHERAFELEVAERPDFFYPFIDKIINDERISLSYPIRGINGLINAKYDVAKVYRLILKQINKKGSDYDTFQVIRSIDYVTERMDDVMFNFLCKHALNTITNKRAIKKNAAAVEIGNSIRNAAIDQIMKIDKEQYVPAIFTLINKVIKNEDALAIKTTIITKAAYLIKWNPNKAFNIFTKVLNSDKRLIKNAMWSADCFAKQFFHRMNPFFEIAIAQKEKDTIENCTIILAKAWITQKPHSEDYLFKLLKRSRIARAKSVMVALRPQNLINEDGSINERCVRLFEYSLNKIDQEIVHQYSAAFLHFDHNLFDSLFPLLRSYSKSKVFRQSPAYFCKYVTQSCNTRTVHKCAALISNFDKLAETNITQGNHYDSEPLDTVIAVYNTLGNTSEDKILKNQCMDIFDRMLQHPQHRNAADQVIASVDI